MPEPEPVASDKLPRVVRYLALNPCRRWSGNRPLVSDPLAWPWSTHRDAVGAIAEPWVEQRTLAQALRWREADFASSFHRYVSSDPHVDVAGTPLPRLIAPSDLPAQSLTQILSAAAAATRSSESAILQRGPARQLFIGLARRQGWRTWQTIAVACDMHPSSARQAAALCPEDWLSAGALCLSDPRLFGAEPARSVG